MYSPEAISRDISSNLMYSGGNTTNGFKNGYLEGDFFKSKEMMGSGSDLFQTQIQQQNSGLMRYRSAPSTFFGSYLDGIKNNNTGNNNSDSSESDSMFSALLNCNEIPQRNHFLHQQQQQNQQHEQLKPELVNEAESNPSRFQQNGNEFSSVSSGMVTSVGYQAAVSGGGGTVVGSYPLPIGVENHGRIRMQSNGRNSSNLIRQSSSPAGFFSGYDVMREVANFRNGNNGAGAEASSSAINFTSAPSSSLRYMPSIAENANETMGSGSPENQANQGYVSGSFQNESWNDSSFNILKRNREGDLKMYPGFSGLDNQDLETRNQTRGLTHHLSLPKNAVVESSGMDEYLQFQQDSVLCKLRAKRGCATHPRSIAERMRRTRISDRMKKLQDLFPNLDKQTNTADMLDLAVEYIKDLQSQVQTLTETRAKCTCSSKLEPQCSSHHDV